MGTSHEDTCKFTIMYRLIIVRMRCFQTKVVEKIKHAFHIK